LLRIGVVRLARQAPGETKTKLPPLRPVDHRLVSSSPGGLPMSPIAIVVIAFGMSVDAFAAALAKGASLHRPQFREALRTGAIFGTVEAITPVIGWAAGLAASTFVQEVDHWIALFLLGGVGAKMIYESFARDGETVKPQRHSLMTLIVTAVGTSIDAAAVGVTLAFLDANIVIVALAIGFATFTMTTSGVMIGRYAGAKLGKRAELIGGIALIALGVRIFVQHMWGI
jgi:putative Mn2+ efflux pump MntP